MCHQNYPPQVKVTKRVFQKNYRVFGEFRSCPKLAPHNKIYERSVTAAIILKKILFIFLSPSMISTDPNASLNTEGRISTTFYRISLFLTKFREKARK